MDSDTPVSDIADKLDRCRKIIASCDSAAVAFSGGVDSSLLLAVAAEVLPANKLLAVMATGDNIASFELDRAKAIARQLNVKLVTVNIDPLADSDFARNTDQRCYYCKRIILSAIRHIADSRSLSAILSGSNASDAGDHRPGSRAEDEFGVIRPLKDTGLTKPQIRQAAKDMQLSNWDAPSAACLISRIPYDQTISTERLKRIEAAEDFLRKIGFTQLRVRDHQQIARIEIYTEQFDLLLQNRQQITAALKKLGYSYITLDLTGFKSGSMNLGL